MEYLRHENGLKIATNYNKDLPLLELGHTMQMGKRSDILENCKNWHIHNLYMRTDDGHKQFQHIFGHTPYDMQMIVLMLLRICKTSITNHPHSYLPKQWSILTRNTGNHLVVPFMYWMKVYKQENHLTNGNNTLELVFN